MKRIRGETGLTLVELLMAVSILSIIALAFFSVTHATLTSWSYAGDRDGANDDARVALERMTEAVRSTNWVVLPFRKAAGTASTHRALCVAAGLDADGDGRIDEDSYDVFQGGTVAGLPGIDDDQDGIVDEGSRWDDDEDGVVDEDRVDGVDNDGDGRIDEDWGYDLNNDGAPGWVRVDDDGDGSTDEGADGDDDEDGASDEDPIDPIAYYVDTSVTPPRLVERHPTNGTTVLVENLYDDPAVAGANDGFTVTRTNQSDGAVLVYIEIRVRTDDGQVLRFATTAANRNQAYLRPLAWMTHEIPL
jgi:prepilin-type N-terminal cleavage/methylation domain-containing protein